MGKLIINADDYAWNKSCTEAILEAFRRGYITSTTMMSTGEYFDEAASIIKGTPYEALVGIHFDLTEGTPLTEAIKHDPTFCNENGEYIIYVNRYKRLTADQKKNVYQELKAQAERFRSTGLTFHHADSHHHIHTAPFIHPIFVRVMKEYGIENQRIHQNLGNISFLKRELKKIHNFKVKDSAYSEFSGSFANTNEVKKLLLDGKIVEIMCHPDFDKDGVLIDRASNAPYDEPFGVSMELLYRSVCVD